LYRCVVCTGANKDVAEQKPKKFAGEYFIGRVRWPFGLKEREKMQKLRSDVVLPFLKAEFVMKLHGDLQKNNVDCWMAEHDVKGGNLLLSQIEEAIDEHNRVLLILSEYSISSNWVIAEILRARAREKINNTKVLFPIRLVPFCQLESWRCFDSDTGEDLAKIVRSYYIPDSSEWRDVNKYKSALDKLLNDLFIDAETNRNN